jgi:RNase P/RNase MRP subunit p30
MRFYADLHLCPQFDSLTHVKEMVEKAAELGYTAVGIPVSPKAPQTEAEELRAICIGSGVDYVSRVDLSPRTAGELLNSLRNLRRRTEVIAVKCYSKEVARQAAKDRRVDLVLFPLTHPKKRFFDFAEAELASEAQASLEIDVAPLLTEQGYRRSILLSCLRRETQVANKGNVPIVLSSGANEPMLLRNAEDYGSLAYLFGMSQHDARQAFSVTPKGIVEQNRRKLSPNFLAPGVYVVRRGKD